MVKNKKNSFETELAIIGGGPAGLAAAKEAAESGVHVTLIDENDRLGGQLFKQIHKFFGSKEHGAGIRGIDIASKLIEQCRLLKVDILLDTATYGIFKNNEIGIVQQNKSNILKAKKIIIATGANENMFPFEGWDLPGVMGAGALQTMMNIHRILPGKRILMIGSGNVGLIVSYQALQAGANVIAVIEGMNVIGGYGVHAAKICRAGVPIMTSYTIKAAIGLESVKEAVLVKLDDHWNHIYGSEMKIEVDIICLSLGLSPLAELAWMAGCKFTFIKEIGGFIPLHDCNMKTTIDDIYVAGDITGIEEASTALEEGRLAGLSVAQSLGYLENEVCLREKEKINTRLQDLRSGPFGEKRREYKEALVNRKEGYLIC